MFYSFKLSNETTYQFEVANKNQKCFTNMKYFLYAWIEVRTLV